MSTFEIFFSFTNNKHNKRQQKPGSFQEDVQISKIKGVTNEMTIYLDSPKTSTRKEILFLTQLEKKSESRGISNEGQFQLPISNFGHLEEKKLRKDQRKQEVTT